LSREVNSQTGHRMTFSPFHPCPGIVWLFLGVFLYPPADINVGAGGGRIQERRAKENEEPLISGSAFLRFRSSPHSPHPDRLFFSLIWMGMESEPPSRADSSLQESHKQDKALLSPQPQVQKDRGAVKGTSCRQPLTADALDGLGIPLTRARYKGMRLSWGPFGQRNPCTSP